MRQRLDMNTTVMRIFLWSGVVLMVATAVAQGLMMGFIPPPSPALSAEEMAQIFIARRNNILLGCLMQCICWSFYATWAIPIIMCIRKMESGMPGLTYASLVLVGGCWIFLILIPLDWVVIAFRAETLEPSTIQMMNDWAWFVWLYTWPSFALWMFVIASAIFLDGSVPKVYPRWLAFYNVWTGVLLFPAGLIGFFKQGPFAYDGLISFWLTVVVFFSWMTIMTVMTFRVAAVTDRESKNTLSASPRFSTPSHAFDISEAASK